MNYCDKCNVNIEDHLNYCPLCGRCVGDDSQKKNNIQNYPKITKTKKSNHYAVNLSFWALILINILVVTLELIISKKVNFFWHTLTISCVISLGVLYPLSHNWSWNSLVSSTMIMISGYLLFLELYTNSFGWGIRYVIPLIVLAVANFEIVMICVKKLNKLEQIFTLFVCFLESLGLFLYNYLTSSVTWPSLAGLLEIFAFLFILFVVRYKKTKKELHKGFHI